MSTPIMDSQKIEEFRSYSDGNDDFIKELFEQYHETSVQLLEKIQQSFQNKDTKQLLSDVHTLKGSTRNMGLEKFGEFIIDWEKRLKEGSLDTFDEDYKTCQDLYQEVKKYQEENFAL